MENKDLKKMADLVKDIRVAMFTTIDSDGELRSRPMATTDIKGEDEIYFISYENSPKIEELDHNKKVNINYVDRDDQIFVSLSGNASHVRDKNKISELWTPFLKAWFPNGKDDSNICLLKVKITKAEYWDKASNRMILLTGLNNVELSKNNKK